VERYGEDGARPFLEEDRERMSGTCQKCNKSNSSYALGFIFHHKGTQILQLVAREVVNSSPLGTVES